MRRGEITNLTWRHVDLPKYMIRLLPDDTKTGQARAVPLSGPALSALQKLHRKHGRDTLHVFPAPGTSGEDSRLIDIQSAWKMALERAGLEDFRFHDLRHTAASYLAMNEATSAEIAEVLGHKTLQMVQRYAHLTEAHTRAVVERMNDPVFGETRE
jgi:integrase